MSAAEVLRFLDSRATDQPLTPEDLVSLRGELDQLLMQVSVDPPNRGVGSIAIAYSGAQELAEVRPANMANAVAASAPDAYYTLDPGIGRACASGAIDQVT